MRSWSLFHQGFLRLAFTSLIALSALEGASTPTLKMQSGLFGPPGAVAFSPDGRSVALGSLDNIVRLFDVTTGFEIRRFEGHSNAVWSVAFSPDGRRLVTSGDDETARLWDVATGRELQRFVGHSHHVTWAAFSPDGLSIVTACKDKTARLWDVASGRELRRFEDGEPLKSAALSPGGRFLLTSSYESAPKLWDLATAREIRRFQGQSLYVNSVAFSPDGRSVATGGDDNTARLWDLETGQEIRRFEGHEGSVNSVAFSPDGRFLLTGGQDRTARLWETGTGREIRRFTGHSRLIWSVAFAPDGRSIITGAEDNTARLWEVDTGREFRRLEGHSSGVRALAFSSDGRFFVTGSNDKKVRLWDVATGQEFREFSGHSDEVRSVAFAPDGKSILSGSTDGTARLWDVETGREIDSVELEAETDFSRKWVSSVGFAQRGRLILTGGDNDPCRLWDVTTRTQIRSFGGNRAAPSLTVSPDGNLALTGGNHAAVLWNLESGAELRQFTIPSGIVRSVAFSPDGRLVAAGNSEGKVWLWDAGTGRPIRNFSAGSGEIFSVVISLDGHFLLTSDSASVAQLWNVDSGRVVRRFEGHSKAVMAALFFPDGRHILTAGIDGTSKVWDASSGELLATLAGLPGGGWAVVTPSGRFDTNALDGTSALYWMLNEDPDHPLPLEIFMRQYYTPRLLPRILAGEKLPGLPNLADLNRAQPEVTVQKIEPDPEHPDSLRAVIEVEPQTNGGKASGARDLRVFRDGQLVAYVEGDLKNRAYVFDGIRLAHRGPKQPVTLTAYAFNSDLVKSSTAAQTYVLPPSWTERRGRAFLVDIGINYTAARACSLQYAVSDATAMHGILEQTLKAAGYQVESHLLISDESHPDGSSKEQLRTVLAGIGSSATPDDTFFLTYSGHGYTDADGLFYLFPSDLKGDCSRVDDGLKSSAISSDELTNWMRPIDAGEMVMVLDACYSAASIESGDFKPGPMGNRGLGQLAYDKRIRVLAASQATQPANEAGTLGMGFLSYVLVKSGLEANQADWQPKDGAIWEREWLSYAAQQTPKLYASFLAGKQPVDDEKNRGVRLVGRDAIPLQTPALFDFRSNQDQGLRLK